MEEAKKRKAATVAWTGANGGRLKGAVDYCVRIPSDNTARIQEGHLLLIHLLCALIEQELFKGK
jgi:D-sedoheptulose 7-phosphate isomerase